MSARVERTALARSRTEPMVRTAVEFDAESLRAPFALRCGAILIDYILLSGILVISTLVARMLGGGAKLAGSPLNLVGLLIAVSFTLFNFLVLTWTRGRTIGKWATGLRIVKINGDSVGLGAALLRHAIGYPLSMLTFGLGFLLAVLNYRGRALHDLIAGTMVVVER
jgi:uncharacterized RDD family membrane protein YckC